MTSERRREHWAPPRSLAHVHDGAPVRRGPGHGHERQRGLRVHAAPVGLLLRGAPGGVDAHRLRRPVPPRAYRLPAPSAPCAGRRRRGAPVDASGPPASSRRHGQRRPALVRCRPAGNFSTFGAGQARVRLLHRPLGRSQRPPSLRPPEGTGPICRDAGVGARPPLALPLPPPPPPPFTELSTL